MTDETAHPPLRGIRVVEFATVMAGPVCGMMLADLGAEVIKIERPGGDDTRGFLPPDMGGISAAFLMVNRNKRGIVLDLKTAEGRRAARRLVATADVVVENARTGAMERLGLGAEELMAADPRLIYCSVSGYGRTGPYADYGGYDLVVQGEAGLMSITGEGPGRPPVKVGAPMTDITAGTLAACGVSALLHRRAETGRGGLVDASLFEAGLMQTYWQSAITLGSGTAPGPIGSAHPLITPYEAFEASDGWLTIAAGSDRNFARLEAVLELDGLATDKRFRTNADRQAHKEALIGLIGTRVRERPVEHWLERLRAAGIPCGPVQDIAAALDHPQTRARDMLVRTRHPEAGEVDTLGLPLRIDGVDRAASRPAPSLGGDTRAVLAELGYAEAEIARIVEGTP